MIINKISKKILLFFLIIFINSIFILGNCVEPTKSLIITENTIFCSGNFKLDAPMIINSNNINIECDNTNIIGYNNGAAFIIENKNNVLIKNCNIDNFEVGINIISSEKIMIENNKIKDNQIGILLNNVFISNFSNNNFNNKGYDFSFQSEVKGNNFKNNYFENYSFNINIFNDDNFDSSFINNDYNNKDGPYIKSNYVHNFSSIGTIKQKNETNNVSDLEEDIIVFFENENIILNVDNYVDEKGNFINPNSIIQHAYELRGFNEKDTQKAIEKIDQLKEIVTIHKDLFIDYENNKIDIKIIFESIHDLENVEIYEFIPKEIANDVSFVKFSKINNLEIIDVDPLIVWNYNKVNKDEKIELSYSVNKSTIDLTSLAIASNDNKQIPITVAIGDCISCDKRKNRYVLFVPLLLIPLIVVIFIYIGKPHRN
jgi:hypothetical protein